MYKFRRRTRVKMVVYIKCQEKQTPLVKIFLSPAPYIKPTDAPYIKPTEVICEGAQREVFDLIQEIIFLDNTLILKGISKENQYWMEYYITEGQWVLL